MSTGGAGPQNLDTRLLRFRSRRGEENEVSLASDLLDAGRTVDAQEVVTAALQAKPDDAGLMLLDGRSRFINGDLLGAQAVLLKAARSNPTSKETFRWLGEVLLKRGDPARAAKVLERAQALDPHDRAVAMLHERAQRLEKVAATAGSEEAGRQARESYEQPLAPPQGVQERTVIRSDLTEQLRSMTQQVDADEERDAVTSVAGHGYQGEFEDDGPTNIVPGAELASIRRAMNAPLPPPTKKPRIKKTLAFGTAPDSGEIPAPPAFPAGRAFPDETPSQDAPSTRVEPLRSKASTSPGAAAAPLPPPPKRRLPSTKASSFAASDDEIDDALGALGGPSSRPPPPKPRASQRPLMETDDPFGPSPFPPSSAKPEVAASPFPTPSRPDPFAAPEPREPVRSEPVRSEPVRSEPVRSEPVGPEPPARPAASARGPAPEPSAPHHHDDPFAMPDIVEDDRPAPPPAADVSIGGSGGPEDVDKILSMLRNQGLFEPPSGESVAWAKRGEVKQTQASGTRIGIWMGVAWVLALGLAGGGWYGWQRYLEHSHAQAAVLVEQATREAYGGTHADLVDAERHLREARDLNPHDISGPTLLLFVHSQRALEDGAFDAGFMRPTIARAESMEGGELAVYLDAARAVLAAAEGGHEQARTRIAAALAARPDDPAILYLAGRLEQRLGGETALEHLEAAAAGESNLNAARVALAEARYDEGQAEEAVEILDQILAAAPDHLRAKLWRAFMTSDTEAPETSLAALVAMQEDMTEHGAPTDQVLYHLTRARLLRRQSNVEAAGGAVDEALLAGATEPRLLALVAIEGRRAGRMLRAEQAARTAVTGAPSNPDFRKLLAEIQLARRDGRGALTTLAELDSDDPDVLEMRATAALLLSTQESLTAASEGLDAYVADHGEDSSVEIRALRIRIHVQLGEAQEMLPAARTLAREAPGDPSAALALGEAALRVFDAETAVESLQQVAQASPDDAEGHYLLGRARRMAGDPEGAEQSLRRAVELTPEHTEAKLTLGGLLLDMGSYQAADELYGALARSSRSAGGQAVNVAGRLGRVEALIGLGRLDDAQVQIEALQPEVQEAPSARMTAAHLALARGRAGDALSQIRPLATAEGAAPSVLAVYGDALLAAGQAEPAGAAYAAALEGDAGLPEALIGQAELAVRADRKPDALELLARVERILEQRIRPPSMRARLYTLRGRAHLSGRADDAAAREALRQAVEIPTSPAEAHFFLGEALAGENSPDARASYARYLELAPDGPYASRARRAIR